MSADLAAIVRALGGHVRSDGLAVVRCPAHDDHNPSLLLRVFDDGGVFVECKAGCTRAAVCDALARRRLIERKGGSGSSIQRLRARKPDKKAEEVRRQRIERAQEFWARSRPLADSIAERYLTRWRGLSAPFPGVLRSLRHIRPGWHAPALIARLGPPKGVQAVHIVALDQSGRKNSSVREPKKCHGDMGSLAVELARPSFQLGLAEGVEDALAATELTGVPCWAVLSASRMSRIEIPPDVREIHLFTDNDRAGRIEAEKARREYVSRGLKVFVHRPRGVKDYNDLLLKELRS